MSNLIVDGFGHYGRGIDSLSRQASTLALLAGAWAEIADGTGFTGITTLPWDLANTDLYAKQGFAGGASMRRILPAAKGTLIVSLYVALSNLPTQNYSKNIVEFRDGANAQIAVLGVQSTGALFFGTNGGTQTTLAASSGPVIVAETATHIEIKFTPGTGANGSVTVKANGTSVITATGLALVNHNDIEQFCIGSDRVGSGAEWYFSNLIVRDILGDFNNDIMGDRRVATLIVNGDDPDNQGWEAQPLRRFGNGILSNGIAPTPGGSQHTDAGVLCGVTTDTNMGDLDFAIEGQFRFQRLPTGGNKAVFFGKWDEGANQRSYQLYLGGPSLNNGDLVWRISTDGTNGTATTLFSYPWKPVVGEYYHVAVDRESGVTTVYIDGVPLGTGFADANIYFAGTSHTALMVQSSGSSGVVNTALDGWNDEFRITQATSRYSGSFSPPTDAFPRGPIDDPAWSDVAWLSGWDQASVSDDSGFARPLSAINSAAAFTPSDGGANYQVINKNYANDDNFLEASLLFASGIFTQTVQPANNETVTVGTSAGPVAAVYTWKTTLTGAAFEVHIGGSLFASLTNLMNAILAGPGAGTDYGTDTTVNLDVTAEQLPVNQIFVQALTAGTVGNSIACSDTCANGAWLPTVNLAGGQDIPAFSQFTTQHLPPGASIVDSLTIVRRSWKTDAGTCSVRASFVGPDDGVVNGEITPESTAPTLRHDTFETDPDNPGGALTPTAILLGRLRINRTA